MSNDAPTPTETEAADTRLDGDRPKRHLADDRLGYAGFSRAIAGAIHGMAPREGIVLAINGPWGSGKTSAVNMTIEALEELQADRAEDERIVVVYFNPWWFSAQEDLVRAFFHDVAATLETTSVPEKVVKGLKAVGRRVSKAKDIALGALDFIPGGTAVKGIAGGAFDAIGRASSDERSLAAERSDLADALREGKRRFLVVIDDVDRLPPDEARQIFRMVKSVADLPNVIYLLVFDRTIARAAVATAGAEGGPDWLDKVVQASFDLPPIRSADLQRLFLGELEALAKPEPVIDRVRWGNTLLSAIMPWLTSPRDVRRLINALAVSWPPIAREVDFADFVALETMRLFEPDLHARVRMSAEELTGAARQNVEAIRSFADDLLTKARPARKEAAKEALWRLFPVLERAWRNHGYGNGFHAEWDKRRRACVARHFPAYFGFDIGSDALRRSELEEALADLAAPATFLTRVTAYAKQLRGAGGTKAGVLLDELQAHASEIPIALVGIALRSVVLASDLFCNQDDDHSTFLSVPAIWRVWWAMEVLTRRVPVEERAAILREALDASPSLSVRSFAVRALAQQHGRDPERQGERSSDPLVDEAALDGLQALLLDELRAAASQGTLLEQQKPISLLLHWEELSGEEARSWVAATIEADAGALALAAAAIQTSRSHGEGDYITREHVSVSRRVLAKIVDVDRLESRISEIAAMPDAQAQNVLQQFRTGLKATQW